MPEPPREKPAWGSAPVTDGLTAAAAGWPTPREPTVTDNERYTKLSLIGTGGMGRVWLGWDRRLQRNVALKQALGDPDGDAARHLRHEATIAARLEHPGIVVVHDVTETPDGPLYVMAHVRGQTFDALLAEAATPADRIALLAPFAAACAAVGHAHARGVVHRDLSARNLVIGDDGAPRVIDWGLAVVPEASASPPAAGTPGYTAPEHAAGHPASPRSDVWSLGAVLHRIVYGRLPDEPGEPSRIDPELAAVVARATEPGPDARYPDAGALARDVRRWLEGRQVEAYVFPTVRVALALLARWRVPLTLAMLCALAAVGALVWGAQAADEAATLARSTLARAQAERADEALQRGDPQRAVALATQALDAADDSLARGVLALVAALPTPELLASASLPACPQWLLSGRRDRVLCQEENALWAYDGRREVWRVPDLSRREVRVVGDRIVATNGPATGWTIQLEDGAVLGVDPRPGDIADPIAAARFAHGTGESLTDGWPNNPCGTELSAVLADDAGGHAFACHSGGVVWVRGDAVERVAFYETDTFRALAADRTGRVWGGTTDGRVVPLDGSSTGWTLGRPVSALVRVPDGRLLAHLSSGTLHLLDPTGGATRVDLPGSDVMPLVQADGTYETLRGSTWRRWALPRTDRVAAIRSDHGFSSVAWASDADAVVAGDGGGTLHVFSPRGTWPAESFPWLDGVVKSVAYDPTRGAALAVGMRSHGVSAIAAAPPRSITSIHSGPENLARVEVLADGAVLFIPFAPRWEYVASAVPAVPAVAHGVDTHYRDLAASPDGSRGLVIGERWERVAVGGQVASPVTAHGAWSVGAIANDGRVVLAKGREGLVLDVTDEPVCTWSATAAVLDLAFTPSGQAFVAAHANGWLSVVDTATCGVLTELPAHTDRVAAVAVSAEGGSVVSASWDGTVRVASLSMALAEDPRSDAALSAWREGR